LLQMKVSLKYAFKGFTKRELHPDRDIRFEIREYSSRALTLAALTFAGISLIITGFRENLTAVKDVLLVFMLGLILFIVSYKLDVFSGKRRIFWELQQRLLNYGLLALVIGLCLFFAAQIPDSTPYVVVGFLIVLALHVEEYLDDYRTYKSEYKNLART